MSKPVAAGIVFFVVVVVAVVFLTIGGRKVKVEVCMEFEGRRNCAIVASETREEAIRKATDGACALISGGVGETFACGHKRPVSIRTID